MLGLKAGTVDLVPFHPEWHSLFLREKSILEDLVGASAVDIQHVGSTSIPHCWAKPIVDLAVGVKSPADAESLIPVLVQAGYDFRGDAGVEGRLFFAKGPRDLRTHYLHVVVWGELLWNNQIGFRDLLLLHPHLVLEYSRLKSALAQAFPEDRASYTQAKSAFIQEVLRGKQ